MKIKQKVVKKKEQKNENSPRIFVQNQIKKKNDEIKTKYGIENIFLCII